MKSIHATYLDKSVHAKLKNLFQARHFRSDRFFRDFLKDYRENIQKICLLVLF